MHLLIMESVSVDAVSVPRGWMDYIQALIHRIELKYYEAPQVHKPRRAMLSFATMNAIRRILRTKSVCKS